MFKNAYVRGLQHSLIQTGRVAYPDEKAAAAVADKIASIHQFDPLQGPVPQAVQTKIASDLLDASTWYKNQGVKVASFGKVASLDELAKLAHIHAIDVMEKAAEGSTIEGGDKGNKEPSSAEAKMDASKRPDGYAEDSRGETAVDTRPGSIGKEQEQPNKPSESPSGSNSVTDQSRTASFLAGFLKKHAEGSTIMGGDKGNKEPTTGEGKMDLSQRPQGYAVLPTQGALGELMARYDGQSAIGKEAPHPNAPSQSVSGSNSITQTSQKNAQEDAFITLFKKTAAEISPFLPTGLGDEAKVAHVRSCMGLTTEEKAHYLHGLQKEAAEKTAAAPAQLPPGSRGDGYAKHSPEATHSRPGAYDGRTANQGSTKRAEEGSLPDFLMKKKDEEKGESAEHEKKETSSEEKKEHEKEEDKKEASLLEMFRRISSSVRA